MARFLKSLVTGVVLPYNEAALKSADIRKMSAEECEEYEASMKSSSDPHPDVVVPTVTADPHPDVVKTTPAVEPEVGEVILEDFDPDVEGVLGALEVD